MHDLKFIRENPETFDAALARRGVDASAVSIIAVDRDIRDLKSGGEQLRNENKKLSQAIFQHTKTAPNSSEVIDLKTIVAANSDKLEKAEAQLLACEGRLSQRLAALPNLPADDVPDGADETANTVIHTRGAIPNFAFTPREHADFAPALGLDFESAQAVAGARFAYLRGGIARLNRALGQFMLDIHTSEFGYQEVAPPLLVRDAAMFGTGQLPKFEADSFAAVGGERTQLVDEDEVGASDRLAAQMAYMGLRNRLNAERRWLIPTAEVSLTNLVREKILSEGELPLRFAALTPCFRSEAGAAGKDTRGLIRQHQFDKVELVSITTPDASNAEHERMTTCAETILDRLNLPYRRMLLCAGDMGFTARKTYDLEVWLPGQSAYREISSCSNCGDFQARRMNARYRAGPKDNRFVHTLNGSALAVGRTLVAVLENYQQEGGAVTIPDALLPYMGGLISLEP